MEVEERGGKGREGGWWRIGVCCMGDGGGSGGWRAVATTIYLFTPSGVREI